MKKRKLTFLKRINGYKNGKGTLILFEETHADGDFKGKPIVFWSNDPNYVELSRNGWTVDEEGRVDEPTRSKEDAEERRFALAQKFGVTVAV